MVIIACRAVGFTKYASSGLSFESACCTWRGIQHAAIKFVSELRQVGIFLWVKSAESGVNTIHIACTGSVTLEHSCGCSRNSS